VKARVFPTVTCFKFHDGIVYPKESDLYVSGSIALTVQVNNIEFRVYPTGFRIQ